MTIAMVPPARALAAMGDILGRQAAPHELYNAVAGKRVRREATGSRRYRFALDDAQAEARMILARETERRAAQSARPEEPLLSSAEAMARIVAAGVPCNRAKFFKLGLEHAWEDLRSGNPAYYYRPDVIDEKIEELKAQQDGLLSSARAVRWINDAYNVTVTRDRFYHWLHRGQVIPTKVVEHDTWSEYRFSLEALRRCPIAEAAARAEAVAQPIPIINSSDELAELEKIHGPLVSADGAARHASAKGAPITRGAIKARRHRGTLSPVALFGSTPLFPRDAVRGGRATRTSAS